MQAKISTGGASKQDCVCERGAGCLQGGEGVWHGLCGVQRVGVGVGMGGVQRRGWGCMREGKS